MSFRPPPPRPLRPPNGSNRPFQIRPPPPPGLTPLLYPVPYSTPPRPPFLSPHLLPTPQARFPIPPRFFPPLQAQIHNNLCSINPLSNHLYVATTSLKNEEERWLEDFQSKYLKSSTMTSKETSKTDAPLREVRQKIHEALGFINKLKTVATEVVALERKLQSDSCTEMHPLEISRVRLQIDRKRQICEQLKGQLEAMNASSSFYSKEKLTFIRKFTNQIQDKKAYRRRKRQEEQATNVIIKELHEEIQVDKSTSVEEQRTTKYKRNEFNSIDKTSQISQEEAKRLVLLLDLKAKRLFGQLSSKEEEEIHQSRQYLEEILKEQEPKRPKKKKRKKKKAKKEIHVIDKSELTSHRPRSDQEKITNLEDPERMTMNTLIQRRREWDQYLVVPSKRSSSRTVTSSGSRIPPHFVIPPSNPSAAWAKYLET